MSNPTILMTAGALAQQGRLNLGDLAQAEEALRRLRKHLPDASVVLMANTPSEDAMGIAPIYHGHVSYLVGSTPTRLAFIRRVIVLWRAVMLVWSARMWRKRRRPSRNSLRQDVIAKLSDGSGLYVSGSGGFADGLVGGVPAVWLTLILAMWQLGRPVVVSGQQLGPLRNPLSRVVVGWIVGRADLVGVREPESYAFARRIGIAPERLLLTGDDAWGLESSGPAECANGDMPQLSDGFIAAQVRCTPSTNWAEADLGQLGEVLDEASRVLQLPVVLVSMTFGPDGGGDSAAAEVLARSIDAPSSILPSQSEPRAVKGLLARATVAVGVSNHFLVMAASAGTPAVGLYRSEYMARKLRGLAKLYPHGVRALRWDDAGPHGDVLDSVIAAATSHRQVTAAALPVDPDAPAVAMRDAVRRRRCQ